MLRAALLTSLLFLCAGCADLSTPAVPPPDPKTQMASLETRIFDMVEVERLKIDPNATPLTLDPELADVARKKSADMAAKNYLAHDGPDGSTTASIIMDEDAKFQGLLGENIAAQHYTAQAGVDPEAFARRFVDTWLQSEAHKQNLAYPSYERTGVGAAVNGDTVYVTQLFATDMGLPSPDMSQGGREVESFDSAKAAANAKPRTIAPGAILPKPKPGP